MEVRVSRLAERQQGHVTRRQLLELGMSAGTITRWIAKGRLIPVHYGVYAVGYVRSDAVARAAAAVLAGGPGAVLSHASAAALWGIRKRWEPRLEITVAGDRRPRGIRAHRSRTLTRRDIRHHLGIRVTSPARTVLDCAPRLSDPALTRAVNDARIGRHMRLSELAELLERVPPTYPGASRLLPFVQTRTGPTRAEFEDRFLAMTKRYGLPTPQVNVIVAGWEVDALFAAERLIVELDGWEYHSGKGSFERDRERDAATLEAEHATVRVTWERLTRTPGREAARLDSILRARRQAGR